MIQAKIITIVTQDKKKQTTEDLHLQLTKLIEEGCSILNEDVVIRIRGTPLDETNCTAVSLFRRVTIFQSLTT
jgi:hypothetical protein